MYQCDLTKRRIKVKVLILTNTETYEDRAELIRERFAKNCEVTVFSTDFLHIKKQKRESGRPDFIHLPTRPYKKNISVGRMYSHYKFAKNAFREAEKYSPDILYVMVPANSNAYFAVKYREKHPNVKLVLDLIDLWPESFPLKKLEWFPAFKWWRNMRDRSLAAADVIVTECELYRTVLADKLTGLDTVTLRLAKKAENTEKNTALPTDSINFCYLGSVNNIIDIPRISEYVGAVAKLKPVSVHIIGKGERMDEFVSALEAVGAAVIRHGAVYDAAEKQRIFDICHLGINIMRDSVCVGLTMKSLDYFDGGLPLINSIKGDTSEFVAQYRAGFNINGISPDELAECIAALGADDFISMREAALKIFCEHLSIDAFDEKFDSLERKLIGENE